LIARAPALLADKQRLRIQRDEARKVASSWSSEGGAEIQRLQAENERLRADAERYRFLRRKVCIIQTDEGFGGSPKSVFDFVNLPSPTYIAPDAALELDAAIDHALEGRDE
jgi:hypothetical protein